MTQHYKILSRLSGGLCFLVSLSYCGVAFAQKPAQQAPSQSSQRLAQRLTKVQPADAIAARIVAGARAQLGTIYDASYVNIPYPKGDVPGNRGLCADVVVRALRAIGYDLQQLIHEDRRRYFRHYPKTRGWGRRGPDPNTDHRSVPNQMYFFSQFGTTLPKEVSATTLHDWQPGDFVYWDTGSPLKHAGIISDVVNENGIPLVIHMSTRFCVQEDCLLKWPIIGHFRYPATASDKPQTTAHKPGN